MNDLLKKLLEGVVQPEPVSSKIEYPSPLLEPKRVPVDFSNEVDTVKATIPKPSVKMPTPPFESKNVELPSFTRETSNVQTTPDIFANIMRSPSVDEELKKTQADSLEATRNLMALQGAHEIGAALARQKANSDYVKPFQDIEAKKVADLINRRKEERDQDDQYMQRRDQAMQEVRFNLDFGDETKRRDPNSNESREAVKMLNNMLKESGLSTQFKEGEVSFARIKELNPLIGDYVQAKARKDAAALSREDMRTRRDEAKELKLQEQTNKQVENLGKDLASPQEALNTFDRLEQQLGFSLDNVSQTDLDKNKISVGGLKKDIPGVSVPGLGRVSFYNSDARKLKDIASNIFNIVLKDRSGAAVTDNELERLKSEFSEGRFNSEAELIKGMKDYKNRIRYVMQNMAAKYPKTAAEVYKERGGRMETPKTTQQNTNKKSFPITLRKDGKMVTVSNEAELKEAQSEGWN